MSENFCTVHTNAAAPLVLLNTQRQIFSWNIYI